MSVDPRGGDTDEATDKETEQETGRTGARILRTATQCLQAARGHRLSRDVFSEKLSLQSLKNVIDLGATCRRSRVGLTSQTMKVYGSPHYNLSSTLA